MPRSRKRPLDPQIAIELRDRANLIHDLQGQLLFAEQPFRAEISHLKARVAELEAGIRQQTEMLLWCPQCGERHIDEGEFATKVHHTHACQHCGHVWRPAVAPTVGVRFLPGFKNP